MADLLTGSDSDPFAVIGQDVSGQRSQLAQYSILRAAAYLQNNKNDEALKAFKQALAFDPQNTTAQTYIGNLSLAKGDTYEAIKVFKTMVQSQPTSVDAHMSLANAYIQDKQYAASEKVLKAAAKLDPSNPLPDYTLGLQYSNTGRLVEAENQFLKVQRTSPNDGNIFYALGAVYNKQGKHEDAAKNLEKSLSLKKSFPDANYELGVAYNALGRREDAQKQLSILQSSGSSLSRDLQFILEKPQMLYMDQNNNRNFNQLLGPATPLWMLDPSLLTPSASTQISVAIQFNNEMDTTSVMNPANWAISRANNTEGGYYIPQAGGREVAIPAYPTFVSYNPETRQANVTFTVQQNAATDATIDPSHLVFKFSGTDAAGRQMDAAGDEIDGSALKAF
ncbi:MAG: tetratricopeptide repeat protein [Geobacteraceae bacterium]|nr:tetratricopeptide repeat protein [Geobacteraceae bacterium]NTW81029.1 tetratricopeptide repeat protein [Geobacteraceae bacterium]